MMATVEWTTEQSEMGKVLSRVWAKFHARHVAESLFKGNDDGLAAWEEHFGRALDLGWPVQKAAEIATQKTAHYRVSRP